MNYTSHFNTKRTPQNESIPGSTQVPNSGGGYSFAVDKWTQFHRFLIIGSDRGTYYASEKKLTQENAHIVIDCIQENGEKAVEHIRHVSWSGAAPKNDPAIFALALTCTYGTGKTKLCAYSAIKDVCRIGTHLFQFCQMIQDLRGWSRGLRKGVANFYLLDDLDAQNNADFVAHQLIKYRQRNGWTHKDVLRLSHPKTKDETLNYLFKYAVGKTIEKDLGKINSAIKLPTHPLVKAFVELQQTKDAKQASKLITEHKLPREAVPTELLNSREVWDALLQSMPITAMIRNLGKMTEVGLLNSNFDESVKLIRSKLLDLDVLKKGRVHPLSVLTALQVYAQGHGEKGSLVWNPVASIVAALQDAFYLSFGAVEPTHKNWLVGLDVSGSMVGTQIAGSPLDARMASAAMAMLIVRTEPNHEVMAFSHSFIPLNINKNDSLEQVLKVVDQLDYGATDCSLPMSYALEKQIPIDVFAVYTDSETNTGGTHPVQLLRKYRKQMKRDAKLVVVGMCSNGFTIADASDRGMLDVVGFDLATPQIMADFAKGNI
jgi:60 kDa SS-A/Ro ribonucleoprotein